ncbi:MAG: hypothetical protein ABR508_05065 [Candidatus Baltobacteraceae bacterium]
MLPIQRTAPRAVEFGIYRDGDNNLDDSQSEVLDQAEQVSAQDRSVQFTVEDSTYNNDEAGGGLTTQRYTVQDGSDAPFNPNARGIDMALEKNLARFVARTLDNAQSARAKQTWIDLVDHGAGDGGGLEADSFGKTIMTMPQMAQAIEDGVKMHAQAHPEDAGRSVDGVVANQCLMASLGFADALSHAGVKWLAASPETMVSPGVPSDVAHAIAAHTSDEHAMASAVVNDVMDYRYGIGRFSYSPAAAFDVLDVGRSTVAPVEQSVKALNDAIAADGAQAARIRSDAAHVRGMARIPDATPDMPWHADRPAIAVYDSLAKDAKLDATVRTAAAKAETAVRGMVLAHGESRSFAPFGGTSYSDAAGPTVHFPVNSAQVDPWAPRVSETQNRFFAETDAAAAERVVA